LILGILLTPYSGGWLDYFKMLFFAHANYSIKALIPVLLFLNIFHVLDIRYGIRFLILGILLTPYSGGWLDYFKMLFFAHANYSIKALIPVLLFLNIFSLDEKKENGNSIFVWKKYFFLIVYFLLFIISSISTGLYTIVCGVVPILIFLFINMWKKSDFKEIKIQAKLWIGTLLCGIAGLLIHKKVYDGVSPIPDVINADDFISNFLAVIEGMFRVFGALVNDKIPVYSLLGMYYCLKIAFVVAIIVMIIIIILKWTKAVEGYEPSFIAVSIICVNMIILVLGDMRGGNTYVPYRYLFIGVPLLLVALGVALNKYLSDLSNMQGIIMMLFIGGVSIFMLLGNIKTTRDSMMNREYAVEMTDYFKQLDVDSVFIVNDMDTALLCKGIDNSKKYAAYNSEDNSIMLNYNYYYDEKSFDYYGDKNIIAIPNYNVLTDFVSDSVAKHYTYIGETRWLACYKADKIYFNQ
jgi:hypothetical protein